ncbi:MAG: hypothetical protein JSV82_08075 [Planctomycetota bacterium]|nr:MAG: hypothetical protein JSV82_08075 [Planctomycetota bacterium]
MPRQWPNYLSFFNFAAALLILVGCAHQKYEPLQVCPGKKSSVEALSVLRSHSQNVVPLKANGQCRLQYYAEGKKHNENFPVKLWMNPPAEIYLQGDVAFDAKGIVLGSNEKEFWLSMKPNEISSFWWGKWQEETWLAKLTISPKHLLEALGIAAVSGEKNWSLSKENAFDVLTKQKGQTEIQKIYISNCDYLVRKIEYLDEGKVTVVTELNKYKKVSQGFLVPSVIKIINRIDDVNKDPDTITLNLKSIKSANFTESQCKVLFTRPQPRGFEHIYKIVNGEMIEQSQ